MKNTRHIFWLVLAAMSSWALAQEAYEETIIDQVDTEALGRGESVARVTVADKQTFIRREGEAEFEGMLRNMSIVSGDEVETRNNDYVEVQFLDGSLLQIADRSALEFQAINEVYAEESLTVIKLHDGSVFLHTTDATNMLNRRVIRIDTTSGSAYVEAPGIYRIDMEGSRMRLRTYRGFAELSGAEDSVPIYSGESATIRNMKSPSRVRPFNSFRSDRFERWAYDRRPVSSVSAKYVDTSVASYARDLDDHGNWRYDDQVNTHVWVPYVDAGWRPYHRGYWSDCGPYLSWTSYDPFGYLTHHYGRWMWRASIGWYWIPGYRYSPAWVAWSYHDNYLGWCALGYNNQPYYYSNYNVRGGVSIRTRNYTVINNYWNYVPANHVVNRRRNYTFQNVVVNTPRRITTRRLHVERDDFRSSDRLARVVTDPTINRRREVARNATTGTLFTSGRRTQTARAGAQRVRIESRNTGTVARSRYANATRVTTGRDAAVRGGDRRVQSGEVYGENRPGDANRGSRAAGTRTNSTRAGSPPKRNGDSGGAARTTTPRTVTRGTSRSGTRTGTRTESATPPKRTSTDRSNATRSSTPPKRTNGNATRSSTPPKRTNGNATRSSTPPKRTNGNATRSSTPPKRTNGNATRSSSGNATRRNYTPPKRSSSGSGKATRSNSGNRSSATRAGSSKGSSSATRAGSSKGSSSASRTSSRSSGRSSATRAGSSSRSTTSTPSRSSNSSSSSTRTSRGN